jgi:hypothetical protein
LETEGLASTKDIVHSTVIWESDADFFLLQRRYSTLHTTEANRNAIFKKVIILYKIMVFAARQFMATYCPTGSVGGTPVRTLSI